MATPLADLDEAVSSGDVTAVKNLLLQHPELRSAPLPLGATWIHFAAEEGQVQVMKLLLAMGFKVDQPSDDNPATPLHSAASNGQIRAARWLVEHGASVNARDNFGRTPLFFAASEGATELVEFLISRGADVNVPGGDPPLTAFDRAMLFGHRDVADWLRKHGAAKQMRRKTKKPVSLAKQIVEHVAGTLGEVSKAALMEIVPGATRVAMHVASRGGKAKSKILFTVGLSERPMKLPAGRRCSPYAELMIELPLAWPLDKVSLKNPEFYWPVEWLRILVHQAHGQGQCFGDGDVISNGNPAVPFAPGTQLSCLLLLENPAIDPLPVSPADAVHFYNVIPLYSKERDLYEAKGRAALLNRFQKRKIDSSVNPRRKNVG
jgi:uncharacterized protein